MMTMAVNNNMLCPIKSIFALMNNLTISITM
jgi:hypothetical protein